MRQAIDTGLPQTGRPYEWATIGGGHLCTMAVPIKDDGAYETGAISAQVELTLRNLDQVLAAAGGSLKDVLQVLVYLTRSEHVESVNELWIQWFEAPYPNRGIVLINEIGVSGVKVMMQVQAFLGD